LVVKYFQRAIHHGLGNITIDLIIVLKKYFLLIKIKSREKKMLKSILKGIYWTFLIVLFGLIHLWIDLGALVFSDPEKISIYYISKHGAILFFTLVVTISVTFDYHFDKNIIKNYDMLKFSSFVLIPIVVSIFVICAHFITLNDIPDDKKLLVVQLNVCAFVMVIIYSIGSKSYLFYRQY
jgi:hypothetical protein